MFGRFVALIFILRPPIVAGDLPDWSRSHALPKCHAWSCPRWRPVAGWNRAGAQPGESRRKDSRGVPPGNVEGLEYWLRTSGEGFAAPLEKMLSDGFEQVYGGGALLGLKTEKAGASCAYVLDRDGAYCPAVQ